MGRPTKLTPKITREIVELLMQGNYIETAAACVGISKDTLYNWLKKGARAKKGIYKEFSDAVGKAQAHSEAEDVAQIQKHGAADWKATAWRVERKHPQRWQKRDKLEVEGGMELRIVVGVPLNPDVFGGGEGEPEGAE